MATLTDSTNLTGTITLSKATGTKVTLDTDKKYLTKDIELTINAPTTTATASGATVSYGEGWIAAGSTTVTDANLIAANIKSGITIFGVTGTHEGSSGSGSGSGSGITQDQDGYIILPSTGSGGSGSTPSATQHNIYFEFSDSTNTTIPVYYNDTLLGTMITAYEPVTYGQKTVTLAQLDGVTWYTRPTETWETIYDDNTNLISDTPYPYWWISSLSDINIAVGSVWRITINNVTYPVLTATDQGAYGGMIGNPLYSSGTDDGSGIPFNFFNAGWGAWSGGADMTGGTTYSVKIERRVSA